MAFKLFVLAALLVAGALGRPMRRHRNHTRDGSSSSSSFVGPESSNPMIPSIDVSQSQSLSFESQSLSSESQSLSSESQSLSSESQSQSFDPAETVAKAVRASHMSNEHQEFLNDLKKMTQALTPSNTSNEYQDFLSAVNSFRQTDAHDGSSSSSSLDAPESSDPMTHSIDDSQSQPLSSEFQSLSHHSQSLSSQSQSESSDPEKGVTQAQTPPNKSNEYQDFLNAVNRFRQTDAHDGSSSSSSLDAPESSDPMTHSIDDSQSQSLSSEFQSLSHHSQSLSSQSQSLSSQSQSESSDPEEGDRSSSEEFDHNMADIIPNKMSRKFPRRMMELLQRSRPRNAHDGSSSSSTFDGPEFSDPMTHSIDDSDFQSQSSESQSASFDPADADRSSSEEFDHHMADIMANKISRQVTRRMMELFQGSRQRNAHDGSSSSSSLDGPESSDPMTHSIDDSDFQSQSSESQSLSYESQSASFDPADAAQGAHSGPANSIPAFPDSPSVPVEQSQGAHSGPANSIPSFPDSPSVPAQETQGAHSGPANSIPSFPDSPSVPAQQSEGAAIPQPVDDDFLDRLVNGHGDGARK